MSNGAEAGDQATSEQTVPVSNRPSSPPPTDTETLPGRPDLGAAAFLGSAAGAGARARKRLNAALGPLWRRGWGRVAVAAIFGVVVVVLATSLASPSGPDIAEVPDVRGMQFRGAAEILQRAGFTADKVSYAPADEARNGTVLETIPGAGQKLEVGLPIHIVAGALPTTPTPEVVESDSGGRGGERGKGRKNDRDDD